MHSFFAFHEVLREIIKHIIVGPSSLNRLSCWDNSGLVMLNGSSSEFLINCIYVAEGFFLCIVTERNIFDIAIDEAWAHVWMMISLDQHFNIQMRVLVYKINKFLRLKTLSKSSAWTSIIAKIQSQVFELWHSSAYHVF